MKKLVGLLCALFLMGCTDATMSGYGALGDPSAVSCFSGGQVVFEDESTGYVESMASGVQYRSKTTGQHIRLYMDCIVVSK